MNVLDRFKLTHQCALLTGASDGLGFEIAKAFAQAGADIILVARDLEKLKRAQTALSVYGTRIFIKSADLFDPAQCTSVCEALLNEHERIDILVNNVGSRRVTETIENQSIEDWLSVFNVNLTSTFIFTKKLGARMIQHHFGRIINIASISGFVVTHGVHGRSYEAAKAAVIQFTKAIAVDWAHYGITANAISPGVFLTKRNQDKFIANAQLEKNMQERIPLGFGKPEDIAPLALYLASDASRYMTGSNLVLDGGYTSR